MTETPSGLHPAAFTRANGEPDRDFYARRSESTQMDAGARTAVTALYQTTLPASGAILDLMAGELSHLPEESSHETVIGLDVHEGSLARNTALTQRIVQDINENGTIDLPDASLDAACLCDGFAYLTDPLHVFQEVNRVLRPGAPFIVTFSDNFIPQKAVALWQALEPADRTRLVSLMLDRAGFGELDTGEVVPPEDLTAWNDTVHAVIGRKKHTA
ncbi:class I SAM-dependent methyltransferase [Asaia lannensis]|uniref:class I SAM-dependent methyltransferase n=1 Tax=Asaia lannensis TaxID=415421 RepID=UPI003872FC64